LSAGTLIRRPFVWRQFSYRSALQGKDDKDAPGADNRIADDLIVNKSYTWKSIREGWSRLPSGVRTFIAIIVVGAITTLFVIELGKEPPLPQLSAEAARMVNAIRGPTFEDELLDIFATFSDKASGTMNKEQWMQFGELYWRAVYQEPREEVIAEVRKLYESSSWPSFIVGPLSASAAGMIALDVMPLQKESFLEHEFKVVNRSRRGAITFNEFMAFIPMNAPRQVSQFKNAVREAVADNIRKNNGALKVERISANGVSHKVTVTGNVKPEDVLRLRQVL
jgi:hypothetical protein